MSSEKWSLKHKASIQDVKDLIEEMGFEAVEDEERMFVKKISSGTYWREMKVRLNSEEAVCYQHKEEESTTETYFEYLTKTGFIMGQMASRMELLPVKDEDLDEPASASDDDDDDDTELAGDNGD
jgi:hypothetical protein